MSESFIYFHYESVASSLISEEDSTKWILRVISEESKEAGQLNFIFCTDDYLHDINLKYLEHDTYTDIITFNYVTGQVISGDIFISIERVKENAKELSITFKDELARVMVHGVLHLIGYNDKSEEEAREIRAKEDFYITLHS